VHLRSGDEQLERTTRAQLLEVDLPVQQIAQWVQSQWVELRWREGRGPGRKQLAGWRQAERVALALGHHPQGHLLPNPRPEIRQALASAIAPALHPAIGKNHRVHGPGAAAAQSLELNAWIVEQSFQHAPGECPVHATALKRKVEPVMRRAQTVPELYKRPRA